MSGITVEWLTGSLQEISFKRGTNKNKPITLVTVTGEYSNNTLTVPHCIYFVRLCHGPNILFKLLTIDEDSTNIKEVTFEKVRGKAVKS